ncbi:MAG: ATP-binding protein [Ruminiclostridium sp.]|nr:ATP-binding protein [Ruminiclostridium sp.]
MKLSLKNIGMIKEATVEINGITVIAGENNTGKSTVGKALFSIFNSFYNIEEQIKKERIQIIGNLLALMYRNITNRLTSRVDFEDIAANIIDNSEKYLSDKEALKHETLSSISQYDENFGKYFSNDNILEMCTRITEILKVSNDDIFRTVLSNKLDAEFSGQVNDLFSEQIGEIDLQIKDTVVSIIVSGNMAKIIENRVDLKTEVIYIDDPFVIDEVRNTYSLVSKYNIDHKFHLARKLISGKDDSKVIDEIIATNKLENIYEKLNSVCSGDVVRTRRTGFGYRKNNNDKVLDVRNLSSGLKTFIILKSLLVNGSLVYNGTIILDEPEIHLHPEWQLLFAELIILIQKEFSMHILLNTHSPYFLRAIQVYSAEYEIADKCKYYLSELKDEKAYIIDVSNDLEQIYKKLSYPLQKLEDKRWIDD